MLPLFDLMMQAQKGQATEAMARQFGLAQEQMQKALSALVPAFSSAFKRTAADPYDFTSLMQAMTSGNYAQYFEDLTKAFSPKGIEDGNAILGQIFGSKDVSRAIAAQAAQMSGIGQDLLKRMMPIVATTMVGGLFRQIAEQFQAAGDAFTSGNASAMFENWLKATGFANQGGSSAPAFENPFLTAFQTMMKPQQAKQPEFAANPFLQMWAVMTGGATPTKQDEKPSVKPDTDAIGELFTQMFDSGIEVQKSYQKSMDDIFESYLAGFKSNSKDPMK